MLRLAQLRPSVGMATPRWRPLTANAFHSSAQRNDEKDASGNTSKQPKALSFEDYRQLKNKLKNRSRIAGIPFGFLSMFAASFTAASLNPNMFDPPDPMNPELIFGMDPIIVSVGASMVSGVVGYNVGAALQGKLWGLMNRELSRQVIQKDEDFLRRIAKYRVETHQKQDDDYYGEKIQTLADYRRWLRQQRKKRLPPDDTKLEWKKAPVGF